ncbi:hypothetical protein JOQ06_023089 [Pogonophryne albipinna]|uniref:Uncharacterized protein n=1 Tax=Pogonophryne albipinna TaxID=1090488 RepID=A0AAD6A9F9_9TELE|nr:hypothetical protein JOQ06_023089 [Pogonophryne albipinna]
MPRSCSIRREDEFGHLWDPKSKHVLKNEDIGHPDYTPSLFPHKKTKSPRSVLQRLERRRKQRVTGALKSRYHILDGPLPLCLVKRLQDERQKREETMIDRIMHVCAALMNLSGSVMYNRYRI